MTRLVPNADAEGLRRAEFRSANSSRRLATGRYPPSPTSSRYSSPCWAFPLRSGAAGWSTPVRARPGFISALCWGGGLVLLGVAVAVHQLWLVYLVAVICGVGQGLGYITPVSTLIKWFPDRRGMATGFAILGYGGGAMIGAPLAVWLMGQFHHERRSRRDAGADRPGRDLFHLHGRWRIRIPRVAQRLAADRLDAADVRARARE